MLAVSLALFSIFPAIITGPEHFQDFQKDYDDQHFKDYHRKDYHSEEKYYHKEEEKEKQPVYVGLEFGLPFGNFRDNVFFVHSHFLDIRQTWPTRWGTHSHAHWAPSLWSDWLLSSSWAS